MFINNIGMNSLVFGLFKTFNQDKIGTISNIPCEDPRLSEIVCDLMTQGQINLKFCRGSSI